VLNTQNKEDAMARAIAGKWGEEEGKFQSLMENLNGKWHKKALQVFLIIVLAHWAEHIVQAVQIFVFGWARPESRGALGLVFPWLVSSEALHYAYAIVMLVGLIVLRPGFQGTARKWWDLALGIQVWHHFEHFLLLAQAVVGMNLFGSPVPTSIAQLIAPRVELHLFYNAIVFIPMVIAMYYHVKPPASDRRDGEVATCSCVRRRAYAA
jgi:hypothetical protein